MDMMKVDLSFDIEMETSEGVAQVNTLIVIAHALKLKVIAEGVLAEHHMCQFLALYCDKRQGFLFSNR
jgi:EAL domain-containing protein (putative c-di-GMP-specific phosphodiesterase class I)